MITDRRPLIAMVMAALTGVFASVLMFWITVHGPGVSPDSVIYLETARSLLSGNGFTTGGQPMTHFPPVYPLLLAATGLLQGGNVLQAGHLLCVLLFGVNTALLGLAVFICTKHSLSAMGCAMCIFLVSAPIISIHSMAWSEAPFITFTLVAFILISLHIVRPGLFLLLAASLSAGCAMATRYAGVTLMPPVVFGLLFFGGRSMKHKIGDTFLAVTVASLPLASWLIHNIMTTETATDRTFAIHIFNSENAKELVNTLHDFVLPISIPSWIKAFFLAVAAVLFLLSVIHLRRKNFLGRNPDNICKVLPILCILFFLMYIPFLVVSISFFDDQTPLDYRILLPAYLAIVLAGISLAWSLSIEMNSRIIWYGFILLVILSVAINSKKAMDIAEDIHRNGIGYTSPQWRDSRTIASVISLDRDIKIYSNGPDVIQFLAGRTVVPIPLVTLKTLEPNLDFEEQLQVMCREVRKGKAVVVYFDGLKRWNQPTMQELDSRCALPVLARLDNGTIYGR